MASVSRTPQALTKGFSAATRPRYVCRACKLIQREGQQLRHNSSLSSQRIIRPATSANHAQRRSVSLGSLLGRSREPSKPQNPQEAALVEGEEEVNAVSMEPYVEATTWDGLEQMGHEGHWKDLPADPRDKYRPWLDPTTAAPPRRDQFLPLLWVSIVECLALKEMAKDPSTIHRNGPPPIANRMSSLKIQLSSTGTISHLTDSQAKAPSEEADEDDVAIEFSVPEIEEQLQGAKFDFRDPITFTILKRFSQLTSHRLPDPLLNTIMRGNKDLKTFIDLLTQTAKPKSKTFAEVLLAKQKKAIDFATREQVLAEQADPRVQQPSAAVNADDLATTPHNKKQKTTFQPLGPNVTIIPRRETQIDREMEVGRWKVIKKELKSRGLPVYALPKHVPQGERWLPDEEERVLKKGATRGLQ